MKRLTFLILASLMLGCGQREQPSPEAILPEAALEKPVLEPVPRDSAVAEPSPPATRPQVPQTPVVFEYPADLAGRAIAKAVTPEVPSLAPVERFGAAPQPRTPPTRLLNPEPTVQANYSPPLLMPTTSSRVTLSPPREQVPYDFGRGADALPARPSFPITAAITERARDVNLPPALPKLGRPLTERVSVDDPSGEYANAAIVGAEVNVPLASAEFVKVALPDPFEWGDQVKAKLPPQAEPGLSPVPIAPQRVK
jgi:hypothetical protein